MTSAASATSTPSASAPLSASGSASTSAEAVRAAADEYLDALGRGDELRAVELVTGLLDAGSSPQELLLELVTPAQMCVGELWESGRWSVAQEHAATCIAERVVAAVGARTRRTGSRGHVVLSCLDGEWHALTARIVGEVLKLHDWRVTFLGASVPPVHLVSFLHQHGPDVVALSATLPIRLPAARQTVVAAQRT
jgi:methanogenic corrinoid protein MtbC1